MAKRWSSTRSDLLKTKRQASKEYRREMVDKLLRLDMEPPEAAFDTIEEMMSYLDSAAGEEESK